MRSISTELSKLTTVDGNRELTTEEVNEIITAINEKEVWKIDLKRQERRQEKTEIDKFKDSLKKEFNEEEIIDELVTICQEGKDEAYYRVPRNRIDIHEKIRGLSLKDNSTKISMEKQMRL